MSSNLCFIATCAFAFATSTAAQSCSAPPFYPNPAYGVKSGCIPTNYNSAADLGNTNPTDAATRCAQNCARVSNCGGWAAQLNKADDSGRYSCSWFLVPVHYSSRYASTVRGQAMPTDRRSARQHRRMLFFKQGCSDCFLQQLFGNRPQDSRGNRSRIDLHIDDRGGGNSHSTGRLRAHSSSRQHPHQPGLQRRDLRWLEPRRRRWFRRRARFTVSASNSYARIGQRFTTIDTTKHYQIQTYAKLVSDPANTANCYYYVTCQKPGSFSSADNVIVQRPVSSIPSTWTRMLVTCPLGANALTISISLQCNQGSGPVVLAVDETAMYPLA